MNNIVIKFSSVTYAMKVKRLLNKAGIFSTQTKLMSPIDGGCRHGIIISENDLFGAVSILKKTGIAYSILSEYDISR